MMSKKGGSASGAALQISITENDKPEEHPEDGLRQNQTQPEESKQAFGH